MRSFPRPAVSQSTQIEEGKAFIYDGNGCCEAGSYSGRVQGRRGSEGRSCRDRGGCIETRARAAARREKRPPDRQLRTDGAFEDGDIRYRSTSTGSVDGQEIRGRQGWYGLSAGTIGSHSFIEGFEEQLIGKKTGEDVRRKRYFPG